VGGQNDGKITETCFDPAGNRTSYVLSSSAPNPCSASYSATGDFPPTTVADQALAPCNSSATVNLVANDSNPDGDPLTVTAISRVSGGWATSSIVSSSSVTFVADSQASTTEFTYTVVDGNGGSAVGQFVIDAAFCERLPYLWHP
tara:strand:- start:86 stop:520 length:435 start_codon:yes stop_codon:yes gene_type:complete